MKRLLPALLMSLPVLAVMVQGAEPARGPVDSWSAGVRVRPVSPIANRHTIHSYYVANPESPDGKRVLFFASTDPAAEVGDVRILDRQTGQETVVAENVRTEDAHRAACQQWLSGGKRVAFHEVVDGRWRVVVADVATGTKSVVAENRQVGFGQPEGDLLPIYGCHWNPGPHRDLEIWNASTNRITTAAKIADVEARYGDWLAGEFGGRPTSIFFPVLSPDLNRVFFKIAAGNGGDNYKSRSASRRQGIVCCDLARPALLWQHNKWGHPAWHPDSRQIFEVGNLLHDVEGTAITAKRIPGLPAPRGSHPTVSPDATLMATDGESEPLGGKPGEWGIVVGDLNGGQWTLVHSFGQSRGATSWRRNHPHPVFSRDSRRIYYNVSDGEFTRLFVAEAGR